MIRFALTTLFAAAIAASALAEEPVRFFIERIDVRDAHRVSADVVRSESLLREGAEYSEEELRAAVTRLTRLPFLLAADFALEKGSDRGRHVLVITVSETRPFFFLLDARPLIHDDTRRTVDFNVDRTLEANDAAAGFRWFVGGRGVVHLGMTARRARQSFTTDYTAAAIGYTRYDLFGTRAFASVNVRVPVDSPARGSISPELVAGIPLTARQTLTLDYEDTILRRDTKRLGGTAFDVQDAERRLTVTWTYNSTDQPFVPTRGTILRIAPLRSMRDRADSGFGRPMPTAYAQHVTGDAVDVDALRYWALSERTSVSAGVLAGWARVDDRIHPSGLRSDALWRPSYRIVQLGVSRALHSDASRLELEARTVARQRSVEHGEDVFGTTPADERDFEAAASWVRRSSWGVLRLGVGYSWRH